MFRKIISNLPFSPSLINELGFYAKRLRKEEATRRIGLILTALALVVQSFATFSPPESANAANSGDLVYGGFSNRTEMLSACKNNTQGFRDLIIHADITCEILANSKFGEIHSRVNGKDAGWLSWNRTSRFSAQKGETSIMVGSQQIYVRPLAAFDIKNTTGNGSYYKAFTGKTTKGKDFAIMIDCANILLKERPSSNPNLNVCDLSTRKVITILQSQFNSANHSKNLNDCNSKPIQVCDIVAKSVVTIDERDFDSKKYSKNLDDCKEKPVPTATCSSLTAKMVSRTEIKLEGAASTANGATIKSYTYVIKDKNGKEVAKKTVSTPNSSSSFSYNATNQGSYTAELTVSTSLGDRTGAACKTSFEIEPEERCPLNPSLPISDPECQPCPGDPNIWVKDEECSAKVIRNKTANNLAQDKDATTTIAQASDRIEFVLTAKNEGKESATFNIEDNLADILEYSTLSDRGGGTLDEQTKILTWENVTLNPGETTSRAYVIQVQSQLSPMAQGTSDPTSYDCRMVNTFGNSVEIKVNCPTPKVIEQTVTELPRTGPTENMVFAGILVSVVTFLYLRTRQLGKEVRLIRREVTAGTI